MLAFAFVVEAQIAARGNVPGLHNLLDFYFAVGPQRAIVDAAFLVYRPPLLDILPMYVFFLLLTPLVLSAVPRVGWRPFSLASFGVWLAAQFGLRLIAYNFMVHSLGVTAPLNAMGSFDLWGWQFLWMIGLCCGVRWAKEDFPAQEWARRAIIPAAIVVPILLVLRYLIGNGLDPGPIEILFDKWHLGAVRLINFAAVSVLLIHFQPILRSLAVRPLVLLGQSSLQVFCAHLLFCFLGLTLMGTADRVGGWEQVVLLAATFSALLLTAKMFAKDPPPTIRRPRQVLAEVPVQGD